MSARIGLAPCSFDSESVLRLRTLSVQATWSQLARQNDVFDFVTVGRIVHPSPSISDLLRVAGNIFKTAAIILDYEYHCSGRSEITGLYSKI